MLLGTSSHAHWTRSTKSLRRSNGIVPNRPVSGARHTVTGLRGSYFGIPYAGVASDRFEVRFFHKVYYINFSRNIHTNFSLSNRRFNPRPAISILLLIIIRFTDGAVNLTDPRGYTGKRCTILGKNSSRSLLRPYSINWITRIWRTFYRATSCKRANLKYCRQYSSGANKSWFAVWRIVNRICSVIRCTL